MYTTLVAPALRGTNFAFCLGIEYLHYAHSHNYDYVISAGVSKGGKLLCKYSGMTQIYRLPDYHDIEINGEFGYRKHAACKPGVFMAMFEIDVRNYDKSAWSEKLKCPLIGNAP